MNAVKEFGRKRKIKSFGLSLKNKKSLKSKSGSVHGDKIMDPDSSECNTYYTKEIGKLYIVKENSHAYLCTSFVIVRTLWPNIS